MRFKHLFIEELIYLKGKISYSFNLENEKHNLEFSSRSSSSSVYK